MKRLGLVAVLGVSYAYASACCGVSSSGVPVKFGDQSNIIVWNPETKTEHFVRNAMFDTKAKDFGFIAPTPEVPKLEAATEDAYYTLGNLRPQPPSMSCGCSAGMEGNETSSKSVQVLQDLMVGKYRAVTIKSDDPKALADYLQSSGYASTPAFKEWVEYYAKKKWVLTAFKLRGDKEAKTESGIIRMSFKTDKPFNPYYVPADNGGVSGTLRIYFVSDGKYKANVGESGTWNPSEWDAPVPAEVADTLATELKVPRTDIPKGATVTYFEKYDWLNGAKEDLYFSKSPGPFGMISFAFVAAIGVGLWWFTKTRKAKIVSSQA